MSVKRKLQGWSFEDRIQEYSGRDTILYALGVGCGLAPSELHFVYEKALQALPTMATVLAEPGFWLADPSIGADTARVVHGEQAIEILRPLPAMGTVRSESHIADLVDKGPEKGLFIYLERSLYDVRDDALIARLKSTLILRGDGEERSLHQRPPRAVTFPDRRPDRVISLPILPQAALLYRLSGDMNPLHVDPEIAREAGFPRPIVHGLCTMGIACRAILRAFCANNAALLSAIEVRFSAPAYPGETLETHLWQDGSDIRFRCRAAERGTIVLDAGSARLTGA